MNKNQIGLALDIDETLSWTVGYWMDEMSKRFGNPENLTVKELIKKYRYTQHVPHWQSDEAIEWMNHSRELDSLQEVLPIIENALESINKINKIIQIKVYMTTRPESVVNGTKKWLQKHGFPNVPIIARPTNIPIHDGNKWKAKILTNAYPEIIGIIDDNPGLVDFIKDDYKGTIFLYDNSDHSRKGKTIIPCKTWDEVVEKITEVFS